MNGIPRDIAILETRETLSEFVHRPGGRWLAKRLVPTAITPIHVTILSGIFGFSAGVLFFAGAHNGSLRVAGGIALLLSCILDCADGELARQRGRYSLTGMMLDGLTDNVVGTSVFLGMAYNVVVYTGVPWMWLLGVAAGLSAAAHVWVYDAKKKQYLNYLGLVHPQEVQPISALAAQRAQAAAQGQWFEAFLLSAYIFFRHTQSVDVTASTVAADPVGFWQANRGQMRRWTLMGSSLHFFLLYMAAIISPIWPPAFLACVLLYAVGLNLLFFWLLTHKWDTRAA